MFYMNEVNENKNWPHGCKMDQKAFLSQLVIASNFCCRLLDMQDISIPTGRKKGQNK